MILVVGASGATGRLLVQQLLDRGQRVKAIVRSPDKLHGIARSAEHMSVIHASLLDIGDAELAEHVKGCVAVASCLGHNMSLKGMYGHPRRLVTDDAVWRRWKGQMPVIYNKESRGEERPRRIVERTHE